MKRTLRLALSAALIAGAALFGIAAPASADAAVTYTGVFTGVTWDGTPGDASGQWSVTERSGKVSATFNIFVDGAHHFSYAIPPKVMLNGSTATHFSFMTQASVDYPLVVVVDPDTRTMTYTITGYQLPGTPHYDEVVYFGTVKN